MMMFGGLPFALVVLWRILRGPQPKLTGLAREIRDVVTLRMVLRDSEPDQRRELVAAHRAWRTEPARRTDSRHASQNTARSRACGGSPQA
jgi:hypothetical protein